MPQAGDFVSQRYRIEDVVAEGGHSVVYATTDCRTGQSFALKVLDPLLSRRPSGSARFEQELAILAQLRHPSFVRVHDAGKTKPG